MNITQNQISQLKLLSIDSKINNGAKICYLGYSPDGLVLKTGEFIAGPDAGGYSIVKQSSGYFETFEHVSLVLAPLCWIKDKPVYVDDTLYSQDGSKWNAGGFYENKLWCRNFTSINEFLPEELSWEKQNIKKSAWINLYRDNTHKEFHGGVCTPHSYETKEQALNNKISTDYIDTIEIHWEE